LEEEEEQQEKGVGGGNKTRGKIKEEFEEARKYSSSQTVWHFSSAQG
jgi:hypothetical protein